jgi:polar amino acid transport system ATP-binding protein
MAALLQLEGVGKTYAHHRVLDGVDLRVSEGETLAILGPSGSGKSTLLKCVAQLTSIDTGRMLLDGVPLGVRESGGRRRALGAGAIARQRREIGMVFQNFNLFAHMSALENITLAPRIVARMSEAEARDRAMALLTRVGLAHKASAYPRELSGGQQQRVAIARSLAMQPRLLLFDEPTSALDAEMIREVLDLMTELADERMTMIVVTHETGFARRVARHVAFMDQGRLLEHSEAAEFFAAPSSERARDFLERIVH